LKKAKFGLTWIIITLMIRTLLLIGFIAILSSCSNTRIAELEAENATLKATIEQLTDKIEAAQRNAEDAQVRAMLAQRRAEEKALRAEEAAENARRQVK
jgi:outer membrane murein-binding lipoprotein Lpp